jgi:predicted helicase
MKIENHNLVVTNCKFHEKSVKKKEIEIIIIKSPTRFNKTVIKEELTLWLE